MHFPSISPERRGRPSGATDAADSDAPSSSYFKGRTRVERLEAIQNYCRNGNITGKVSPKPSPSPTRNRPGPDYGGRIAELSRLATSTDDRDSDSPSPSRVAHKALVSSTDNMLKTLEEFRRELVLHDHGSPPPRPLTNLPLPPTTDDTDEATATTSPSEPALPSIQKSAAKAKKKRSDDPPPRQRSLSRGGSLAPADPPAQLESPEQFFETETLERLKSTFKLLDVTSQALISANDVARVVYKVHPEYETKKAVVRQIKNFSSSSLGLLAEADFLRWAVFNQNSKYPCNFGLMNLMMHGPASVLATYVHRDMKDGRQERIKALQASRPDDVKLPALLRERKSTQVGPDSLLAEISVEEIFKQNAHRVPGLSPPRRRTSSISPERPNPQATKSPRNSQLSNKSLASVRRSSAASVLPDANSNGNAGPAANSHNPLAPLPQNTPGAAGVSPKRVRLAPVPGS